MARVALVGLLSSILFALFFKIAATLDDPSPSVSVVLPNKSSITVSSSLMSSLEPNGTMAADEKLSRALILSIILPVLSVMLVVLVAGLGICLYIRHRKHLPICRFCCRERLSGSRREQEESVTEPETSTVFENQSKEESREKSDPFEKGYSGHQRKNSDSASIASSSSAYPPSTSEELSQPDTKNAHSSEESWQNFGTQSGQSSQNEETSKGPSDSNSPVQFRNDRPKEGRTRSCRKSGKCHSNDGGGSDALTSGYCSNTSSDAPAMVHSGNHKLPLSPRQSTVAGESGRARGRRHDPSVRSETQACIPDHMTPISISPDRSRKGVRYHDQSNDFSLEIPEGAIPGGNIDVGVALFGPFQFPEGLRPVSPVFWVCVHDNPNFQFSKPVTVTLPHFLDLENDKDIQSLGLTFLKAEHYKNAKGMYEFIPTDGEIDIKPFDNFGVLQTTHLCSLCIACRDKPQCLSMTHFCITAVLPSNAISEEKKQNAYFFITFYNLKTCLKIVDEVIAKKNLDDYEITQNPFRFKKSKDPAVELVLHRPKYGSIGIAGKTKIHRSEVDFFVGKRISVEDLQTAEHRDFYPPRFQIFLASSPNNPTLGGARINLNGARNNLQYDIHLNPLPSTIKGIQGPTSHFKRGKLEDYKLLSVTAATDAYVKQNYSLGLDMDDLQKVLSQLISVAVQWRDIGLLLGLEVHQLDTIRADNTDVKSCLNGMLIKWLSGAFDTAKHGEPSWNRLSEAVASRAGGDKPALAKKILHLQPV